MAHALGTRLAYEQAPARVRAWVERSLGASVVSASTQLGGFSPGVAARLVTASGRRAFVKAVGPELNPGTPDLIRNEITAMQAIGPLPQTPGLYGVYDDGDWVGILLEDISGYVPPHPWHQHDASRVLDALADLSESLDPAPWSEAPVAAERSQGFLSRWEKVIADGVAVPDWAAGREQEFAELAQTGLDELSKGSALAHWDLRADNLLLTEDRVVFVDWAHASIAPVWTDTVILCGDMYESVDLPDLPDEPGVNGLIAGLCAGYLWGSTQPPQPSIPTMRPWQYETAQVHFDWLRERLG
ncbi:phosphotransferase family protein [Kribbella italica]|uniref:Aminoglycoside phosphotransferase domain-containing protein n=1 Tax=Kribbella italica TaxID=1540520 RepID=A0A7W9J155_9ACTN|nr:phosphotransferase [Kribbella italica]MBB5833678.1 hypothetical protein [Kribbella italica]